MVDDRRADALTDLGDLAQRNRYGAGGSGNDQRQLGQVGDSLAVLGGEPNPDVPGFAARIDPVAGVNAGKGRPDRESHLPDRDAKAAGSPAVELDVDLGFLPFGREGEVHHAGNARDQSLHLLRDGVERGGIGAADVECQLLPALIEVAGVHRGREAGRGLEGIADDRRDVVGAPRPVLLGRESHVDVARVDRARAGVPDRAVGVADVGRGAGNPFDQFRLLAGVEQARARRGFDLDVELGSIVDREETEANLLVDRGDLDQRKGKTDTRRHSEGLGGPPPATGGPRGDADPDQGPQQGKKAL